MRAVLRGGMAMAAAAILASCGAGGSGPPQDTGSDGSPPTTSPVSSDAPDEYEEAVSFARTEIHDRFGHPFDEIHLVLAEPVVWPDASLGCPRTDQTYESSPVSGYRLVLRWDTVEFHYHGADGSLPFQCMFLDG